MIKALKVVIKSFVSVRFVGLATDPKVNVVLTPFEGKVLQFPALLHVPEIPPVQVALVWP
jgi:hypothetical protein